METKNIKKKLIERDGLRCSISGEEVDSPDDLVIEHITPKNKGGSSDMDNLTLVSKRINSSIADSENYRTKLLIKELEERQKELNLREKEAYERENSYRMELEHQKAELEEYRHRLKQEQYEKEKRLSKELEDRKLIFKEQENRLRDYEQRIQHERSEAEQLKSAIREKEESLNIALSEVKKEKERYREESRRSIEQKSNNYVNEALSVLKSKEDQYHNISRIWSAVGALSIAAGIFILSYLGIESFNSLESKQDVSWSFLVLITFKGLIVVGLFVALAKYSFTFSQSYMHESLKNSERRHAINFGKFYLESYGADADWSQVKDAFEHWNISSSTAFSNSNTDSFDPKTLESAANVIDSINKVASRQEKTGNGIK